MDMYYSYTVESLEDSGCLYTFYSPVNKRLYSVSYDTYTYQELLIAFPFLLQNGCALAFYDVPTEKNFKIKSDKLVSPTIAQTMRDYLAERGNDCVLIYHCDMKDGRQKARHVLFERWFRKGNGDGTLIKEGVEVEVFVDNETRVYYLGYITPKTNPNIESIKQEFDAFSYYMPSFVNSKNS